MGFFDKVKTFAGGASTLDVRFTEIERQPPNEASMSINDSVIKGKYVITCHKACTILAHVAELRTSHPAKDGTLGTRRDTRTVNVDNQVLGAPYQFPYDMKPGETMDAGFILGPVDLPACYREYGVQPLDPSVKVMIKVVVDVKGSPFDPEAEIQLRLH